MDSLIHAVLQATLISKFVLVLLLVMSIASWTYMCGKWLTLRAAQRRAHEGLSAFDKAGELKRALPKVESSEVLPTEDDHLILTIRADGALFLDEYETGLADLPDVLAVQVKGQDRQLFVRADKDVPYGMVMQVMDRIRGAGIADVGLITTSTPVEEPPATPAMPVTPTARGGN